MRHVPRTKLPENDLHREYINWWRAQIDRIISARISFTKASRLSLSLSPHLPSPKPNHVSFASPDGSAGGRCVGVAVGDRQCRVVLHHQLPAWQAIVHADGRLRAQRLFALWARLGGPMLWREHLLLSDVRLLHRWPDGRPLLARGLQPGAVPQCRTGLRCGRGERCLRTQLDLLHFR